MFRYTEKSYLEKWKFLVNFWPVSGRYACLCGWAFLCSGAHTYFLSLQCLTLISQLYVPCCGASNLTPESLRLSEAFRLINETSVPVGVFPVPVSCVGPLFLKIRGDTGWVLIKMFTCYLVLKACLQGFVYVNCLPKSPLKTKTFRWLKPIIYSLFSIYEKGWNEKALIKMSLCKNLAWNWLWTLHILFDKSFFF